MSPWDAAQELDPMTEKLTFYAEITSENGHRLRLFRRREGPEFCLEILQPEGRDRGFSGIIECRLGSKESKTFDAADQAIVSSTTRRAHSRCSQECLRFQTVPI